MKADRKMTVLIRAKDYLDINKIRVLFKKTLNLSLLLSVHLAFSLVELQVKWSTSYIKLLLDVSLAPY